MLARLQRNYEAIDALNQRKSQSALAILDMPLVLEQADEASLRALRIDQSLANQLAVGSDRSAGGYSTSLTPLERVTLLRLLRKIYQPDH